MKMPKAKDEPDVGTLPVRNPRKRRVQLLSLIAGVALLGLHYWYLKASWTHDHANGNMEGGRNPILGRDVEMAFLSIPDEQSAIAASRVYASKPHMAGTPGDLSTAREFLRLLQSELGIKPPPSEPIYPAGSPESRHATLCIHHGSSPRAWIDTYYPMMNTPLDRHVQILGNDGSLDVELDLVEVADEADSDASKYNDAVPTFHGLSRAGDVTGNIMDGGYCTKEEFDRFVNKGVSFNGTIVLCRYGGIFRGLKVKGAQELGAVGVLTYSDVNDDGTVTEANGYAAYPHGPARNPTSVQRGSAQFISVYPGDPTTPGYPSYENSTRTKGSNIPSIPSLPISWENARALLRTLKVGDALQGRRVRFVNNVDTRVIPVWNTMAVIPGYIKDEVVVVGNHRDAWVLGATDPTSGTVSVHEIIRGLGYLIKKGWRPLRTILIASWDAEEYGLIGSTEWGEDFTGWINEHVVAYLNLDSSVSGSRFRVSGSPLLAHFLRDIAKGLPHPTDTARTLWDATEDHGKLFGIREDSMNPDSVAIKEMEFAAADNVGISPLGSGSDYTVFLQHIGVPSTNGGFGSTLHDPIYHYHSVFDSERWQELYGDPGFFRHVAISKYLGLQALRLSGSIILPFNTTHYTVQLDAYLDRVEGLATQASLDIDFGALRNSIELLRNASLALDVEKEKADKKLKRIIEKWKKEHCKKLPKKLSKILCRVREGLGWKCNATSADLAEDDALSSSPLLCHQPSHSHSVARFNVGRVRNLLDLKESEPALDDHEAYMVAVRSGLLGHHLDDDEGKRHCKFPIKKLKKVIKQIQTVNKKLVAFERGFISEHGIKDREWYKHLGVAPGKWLGYGATTFPALTEAIIYERNVTLVEYESRRLQLAMDRLSKVILP